MFRVSLAFLALAGASLVAGVSLGIYMGVRGDFALAPVHAHLNLLGWVSLAVFGLAYRVFPELAGPRLATAHFAVCSAGAVLFPIGLYLEIVHEGGALIAIAALLWLVGAIIFFIAAARLVVMPETAAPVRT